MSRTSLAGFLVLGALLVSGIEGPSFAKAQSIAPERALLAKSYVIPFEVTDDFLGGESAPADARFPSAEQALLGASAADRTDSKAQAWTSPLLAAGFAGVDGQRALLGASRSIRTR